MEPFTYTSLQSKNSFRLILLQPGQPTDTLQCLIQTHDAATSPPYEALSYVWGESSQTHPLTCHGKKLLITSTLDSALRRLRLPNTPRSLWVDQLCINQTDLDERTQQVQLMRTIYSQAEKVLIWLGNDPDNKSPGAKTLINRINAVWNDHIGSLRFPSNEQLTQRGLPTHDDPCWKDLEAMLNVPYFQRIWIVQECRLASNLTLLWGTQHIPWMHFYHTYHWIASNSGSYQAPGVSLNIHSEILFSESNCTDPEFSDDEHDWLRILKATRMHGATDPRDKVYGLLGLFGEKATAVIPDYRKPPIQVFADFATRMISQMDSLKLLSFAQLAKDDVFPLWAPRWEWDLHGDMTYKPFEHYDFHASKELHPVTKPSLRWDILPLKGILIDEIECTTTPLTDGLVGQSAENLIIQAWDLLDAQKSVIQSKYTTPHSLITTLVWTLTAGQAMYPHILMYKPAEKTHLLDFAAHLANHLLDKMDQDDDTLKQGGCLRKVLELALLAREAYHLEDTPPDPIPESSRKWIHETMTWAHDEQPAEIAMSTFDKVGIDEEAHHRYQTMLWCVVPWRKMFTTKQGYVGLAAHGVQPGDKICVLFGGATPYVVRPEGDEYLFKGECYVRGLMDGEAISAWEEGELEEQWFYLR